MTLSDSEINNNNGGKGLEIYIPGYKNNPQCPDDAQIFIEYYDGEIQIHVWNGEEDAQTIVINKQDLCECGTEKRTFMHNCPTSSNMPEIYGCPSCDDTCSSCI